MKITWPRLAVVVAGLLIYVGYLQLQLWDARGLWRHQAGLSRYYAGVLARACVTQGEFEAEADALGWARGRSEFADYDPETDSFVEKSYRPNAMTVEVLPAAPMTKSPFSFILFSEDGCFEWGTYPP